ncbi:hypothetical protein REMIM1_PC00066 (plasmid) [Rhizobium etli bv. mimosae str. Mim1]|nr:hypothetical protein REMIM1_PC00066 [Rhizobium etli bv. mimosae str. Mim1]
MRPLRSLPECVRQQLGATTLSGLPDIRHCRLSGINLAMGPGTALRPMIAWQHHAAFKIGNMANRIEPVPSG